jgi:hypothetical protein
MRNPVQTFATDYSHMGDNRVSDGRFCDEHQPGTFPGVQQFAESGWVL